MNLHFFFVGNSGARFSFGLRLLSSMVGMGVDDGIERFDFVAGVAGG